MNKPAISKAPSRPTENIQMDHEGRLGYIEGKLESFATKEDLQKELNAMTWKIIGAIAALVAAVYFITRHVSS